MTRHSVLIVGAILLALIPVVVAMLPDGVLGTGVETILMQAGSILLLVRILYDNSDTIFFGVTRSWQFISNRETQWSLQVEFTGQVTPDHYQEALRSLVEKGGMIWSREAGKPADLHIVRMDGYVIRMRWLDQLEGPEPILGGSMVFELSDVIVPFREGVRRLNAIVGAFSDIEALVVRAESKYSFKVRFMGRNPYLGLFLREMHLPGEITSFEIDAVERLGAQKSVTVQIGREEISLTSFDLHALHTTSRKYITLSSPVST